MTLSKNYIHIRVVQLVLTSATLNRQPPGLTPVPKMVAEKMR